MNPFFYLRSLQNSFSFRVRSHIRFRRRPSEKILNNETTGRLQQELREFLDLFVWDWLKPDSSFIVADIGARNFSFAPVFEDFLEGRGIKNPEIHGFEIDAYRRYSDFTSRADYGHYYAKKINRGTYHAKDFLRWRADLNLAFLLHPFVTPEPPLRWGLPLSACQPQKIFDHAFRLLKAREGFLVLSNPSLREFEISCRLAINSGFTMGEKQKWLPDSVSIHQKPRFGIVLATKSV